MYFVKTPGIVKPLYKDFVWSIPNSENRVFLTFDDGPTPEVTDATLEILAEYDAKATFFLIGKNVEQHPEYVQRLKYLGHSIGNHSYSHCNGWQTPSEEYIEDVAKCADVFESKLMRPPYGKIKREQAAVVKEHYKLIMWDVLSADFDPSVDADQCVSNVVNNTTSGSIIVLHDSKKAANTMLTALPKILSQLQAKGFVFDAIPYPLD